MITQAGIPKNLENNLNKSCWKAVVEGFQL